MNSNTAINMASLPTHAGTATPAAGSPIDMRLVESIRSLNTDGRPDLLAELVSIFRDTTPELLEGLETAASSGDARQLQRLAHRLKGGSGNVGARHMSRLCADLELLARETASTEGFDSHVGAIRRSYDEALEALRALL